MIQQKIVQLSPPWFTLWSIINAAFKNTEGITITPLDTRLNPFIIRINVDDINKAEAIASLMVPSHILGNITVDILIYNNDKIITPVHPVVMKQLVNMISLLFADNEWYDKTVKGPLFPGSPNNVCFLVFKKAIMQFFNDDLSDLYNNYNEVAATSFRNILSPSPGGIMLYPSTTNSN